MNKKFLLVTIYLVFPLCVIAQVDKNQRYFDIEMKMLNNERLTTAEIRQIQEDKFVMYYYLKEIAHYILPTRKKLATELLIEASQYGILDTVKLRAAPLSQKSKNKVTSSYFDNIDLYNFSLFEKLTERLALDQHYRLKWMKSRFTDSTAYVEMKKLDSLNFNYIDEIIKARKVPNRGEFRINFAAVFLHVTSERFFNDSIGFENYRQNILLLVKSGNFSPGLYAVWVDRYYLWHLKYPKQIFGLFRHSATPNDQVEEVMDRENANKLRKEIGYRTIEEEEAFRKLKYPPQK